MAKVALLIGVSEYEVGLNPLPAAVKDVVALERILKDSEMGDFDEVKTLTNPEPQTMQYEVETLFTGCGKEDFVLLFFSGHGIKDESNNLYFATRITKKSPKGNLIKSTAVPAKFIHEVMNNSRAKRQAIILDCCFSGAFDPSLQAKDDGSVNLQDQLGAEGRVVLTSSSSTQYSFEQQGLDLSLYTRYLIEGIETGAGDRDEDGKISVRELHEYATSKVQETAPSMTPKLITLKDLGFDLVLAKAKVTDPKLRYRRQVEKYSSRGAISSIGRTILDRLQIQLRLSTQIAKEIETEVLRPYQERLDSIQRYQQAFEEAVKNEYPLRNYVQSELEDLLEILGLRREDIDSVEQEIITRSQSARSEYQQKSKRYEEEFRRAVESEYPLSPHARNGLNDFQKSLGLKAEDVKPIENPILAQKHQKDLERQKLKDLEQKRQRDADQEKRDAEAKRQSARDAEEQRQKQQRLDELNQQRQRDAEQEKLKSETKRQNPLELPKLPFRLSRRNFMLVAGFSGVSAIFLANIRGNSSSPITTNTSQSNPTPTNTPIITSTPASTSQPKPFTVETGKPFKIELENGVNLEMVYVPNGKFTMGSPPEEKEGISLPQIQNVNISAFYMSKYEVTQAQWQLIMGNNPSNFKDDPQNPVEQVSWNDAQEFCKKISQKSGKDFRLPSEAEWEYACRAGTTTVYYFGDNASLLDEYAWYNPNAGSKTHPVGQKRPNNWGLYDMHGNLKEWCQDTYEKYGGEIDLIRKTGKAVESKNNNFRVLRGGAWVNGASGCTSSYRNKYSADLKDYLIGFRAVCVVG
jgi:formylglycine-generating enzyme required for sulfatase activity